MGTRGKALCRLAALALVAAAWLASVGAPPAGAANGDLVREVKGQFASIGVSVAFDGTYLYYTNLNESVIHRMTTTGVDAGVIPTDILDGINAFSYDSVHDWFWAVDGTGQEIWTIDKMGVAVPAFSVTGKLIGECDNGSPGGGPGFCDITVDGLAYDATNGGSIWYSPDASERVYHFTTTGDLIGYFDVNDAPNDMLPQCPATPERPHGNFNSGIGVGANVAYLTAADCKTFFSYTKDRQYTDPSQCPQPTASSGSYSAPGPYCPGTKLNYFHYLGRRAEDLECDDVTFPQDVMWVRDEESGIFGAYELPTGTCIYGGGVAIPVDKSRMTGGGGLPIVDPVTKLPKGDDAHDALMLHCDPRVQPDQLQISWQGSHFHMTGADTTNCSDSNPLVPNANGASFDTITGTGHGRYNGMPGATVQWKFTDNGEPGTLDHGEITVFDQFGVPVLCAQGDLLTGPLAGEGNYQAHDAK
jgi:hypothetical protein